MRPGGAVEVDANAAGQVVAEAPLEIQGTGPRVKAQQINATITVLDKGGNVQGVIGDSRSLLVEIKRQIMRLPDASLLRIRRIAIEAYFAHLFGMDRVPHVQNDNLVYISQGLQKEAVIARERRWKDTRMPMRYGEKVLASRGAMARAAKSQGRA
jgi:hypothetical protein